AAQDFADLLSGNSGSAAPSVLLTGNAAAAVPLVETSDQPDFFSEVLPVQPAGPQKEDELKKLSMVALPYLPVLQMPQPTQPAPPVNELAPEPGSQPAEAIISDKTVSTVLTVGTSDIAQCAAAR